MKSGSDIKNKKTVFLVDDHDLFRDGLSEIINNEDDLVVIGEACNGQDAVEKVGTLRPDLVLMDLYMPECNGIEALRLLTVDWPQVKVVMLTMMEDRDCLFKCLKAGAQGYILKTTNRSSFLRAIRVVLEGETAISRSLTDQLLAKLLKGETVLRDEARNTSSRDSLSEREKEVLGLVAQGCSNRDIGKELGISESTVKNHVHNILQKMNLTNRVQLAKRALEINKDI